MNANVRFRQARESEALDLACLLDSASRGLVLWLWRSIRKPNQTTIEAARDRIRTLADRPHHYRAFTVADVNGAVAGPLEFYRRHGFAEWTRRPSIAFPGSSDEGDWILLRTEIPR